MDREVNEDWGCPKERDTELYRNQDTKAKELVCLEQQRGRGRNTQVRMPPPTFFEKWLHLDITRTRCDHGVGAWVGESS